MIPHDLSLFPVRFIGLIQTLLSHRWLIHAIHLGVVGWGRGGFSVPTLSFVWTGATVYTDGHGRGEARLISPNDAVVIGGKGREFIDRIDRGDFMDFVSTRLCQIIDVGVRGVGWGGRGGA